MTNLNLSMAPSDRADYRKQRKEENAEKIKQENEGLRRDFAEVYSSAAGKRVLQWHMEQLGFGQPLVGANPSTMEIDEKRTLYSAMRESHYREMRKLIPIETLMEVENDV